MNTMEKIKEFNTSNIVEAVEQTLQEDTVRDNLLISIEQWDKEGQTNILNYLNSNFDEVI